MSQEPTLTRATALTTIKNTFRGRRYRISPMYARAGLLRGVEILLFGEISLDELDALQKLGAVSGIGARYDNLFGRLAVVLWLIFRNPI